MKNLWKNQLDNNQCENEQKSKADSRSNEKFMLVFELHLNAFDVLKAKCTTLCCNVVISKRIGNDNKQK